jgi:hypothetical protein
MKSEEILKAKIATQHLTRLIKQRWLMLEQFVGVVTKTFDEYFTECYIEEFADLKSEHVIITDDYSIISHEDLVRLQCKDGNPGFIIKYYSVYGKSDQRAIYTEKIVGL